MERAASLIVVVDDTQEVLELYAQILVTEGYQFSLHTFQPTNLDMIKKLKPALVIVDLMLGTQAIGWELIEQMKRGSQTANIPIILCSADTNKVQELKPYFAKYNVTAILKPFDLDEFISTVKDLIATSDAKFDQTLLPLLESPVIAPT